MYVKNAYLKNKINKIYKKKIIISRNLIYFRYYIYLKILLYIFEKYNEKRNKKRPLK